MTSPSHQSTVTWPAGHRAALAIVLLVDAPAPGVAPSGSSIGLDYTPNGLERLVNALDDLDLKSTIALSPSAVDTYPLIARRATSGGHELVAWTQDGALEPHRAALEHLSGSHPATGIVSGLPATPAAVDGVEGGWAITGAAGDLPDNTGSSLVIPVSPYWIDTTWLDSTRPLPPSSLLEAWSLSLAAIRTEGTLMTVVLHPHVSGRPGFAGQVVRFLDEAIESGDVWIATAGTIATWWQEQSR